MLFYSWAHILKGPTNATNGQLKIYEIDFLDYSHNCMYTILKGELFDFILIDDKELYRSYMISYIWLKF